MALVIVVPFEATMLIPVAGHNGLRQGPVFPWRCDACGRVGRPLYMCRSWDREGEQMLGQGCMEQERARAISAAVQ